MPTGTSAKNSKKLSLHKQARGRVSGCGVPFPSRRPCSDLAKSNLEVRPSAAKNCFIGDDEPCGPGASRANLRVAPKHRAAAVQESCLRPAEVQQGERQDGATVGQPRALPGKLCPPSQEQSASASYTRSLSLPRLNTLRPKVAEGDDVIPQKTKTSCL